MLNSIVQNLAIVQLYAKKATAAQLLERFIFVSFFPQCIRAHVKSLVCESLRNFLINFSILIFSIEHKYSQCNFAKFLRRFTVKCYGPAG